MTLALAAPVNGVLVGLDELPDGVPATSVKLAQVKRVAIEVRIPTDRLPKYPVAPVVVEV